MGAGLIILIILFAHVCSASTPRGSRDIKAASEGQSEAVEQPVDTESSPEIGRGDVEPDSLTSVGEVEREWQGDSVGGVPVREQILHIYLLDNY